MLIFSISVNKNLSILSLGLGIQNNIITIHYKKTSLDAFRKMSKHNISSLPVVNSKNKIKGIISLSDIKIASLLFLHVIYKITWLLIFRNLTY